MKEAARKAASLFGLRRSPWLAPMRDCHLHPVIKASVAAARMLAEC